MIEGETMRRFVLVVFALSVVLSGCSGRTPVPTGEAAAPVEPPSASLVVRIKERAVEPAKVKKAAVSAGDTTATLLPDGAYSLEGLPTEPTTITVKAPNHDTTRTVVQLAAGENTVTISSELTVRESYRRYYKAYKFYRLRTAYKYLHPDVRKHYKYSEFKRNMEDSTAISLKLGDTRVLKEWKSKAAKRTYRGITEIDRTFVVEYLGRKYTDNASQHWLKRRGLWLLVLK